MSDLFCRFGKYCRAAVRSIDPGGKARRVACLAGGRGLCPVCERFGKTAVSGLGPLYPVLYAELGKDTGRDVRPGGGGSHGNAKVDPPTPLRLVVDAQVREIRWALDVWADAVWERLTNMAAARGRALGAGPDSPMAAARMLARNYSVLLALPAIAYVPYVGDGALADPTEADGPDAVVQLVGLYERARRWAGEGDRAQSRHMACPPAKFGGCGQEGVLVQTIGSERVRCRKCEWSCTDMEYGRYAMKLDPAAVWTAVGGVL